MFDYRTDRDTQMDGQTMRHTPDKLITVSCRHHNNVSLQNAGEW